jgi:hypothetical protein
MENSCECYKVGRARWLRGAESAANARVGLHYDLRVETDQGSGADEGVRPTREGFKNA